MEPARVSQEYKGFTLVAARLKGQFVGQVRLRNYSLFESRAKDYEGLIEQLRRFVDNKPESVLALAPVLQTYKGLFIRCIEHQGAFFAAGYVRGTQLFVATSAKGESDAMLRLTEQIDAGLALVEATVRDHHQATLRKYGVSSPEKIHVKTSSHAKPFRAAHCWACHHPIDNESNQECTLCGWIICSCGACGCSYQLRNTS